MAIIAVVPAAPEISDRIAWWLGREHQVVRVATVEAAIVVIVAGADGASDAAAMELLRRDLPDCWIIVTGEMDQPPAWTTALLSRDRRAMALFPAAPALLQVTARSLLQRDSLSSVFC
ncbi:MAG: hypothetical protein U0556_09060 [Dehalococcoidia bacterium]